MSEREWLPISVAPRRAGQRLELWYPPTESSAGIATYGYWEPQKHNKRPVPYWHAEYLESFGVRWMQASQPTHWRYPPDGPE